MKKRRVCKAHSKNVSLRFIDRHSESAFWIG